MIFLVQFGINKYLQIFFKDHKVLKVFEKFIHTYLFQIALEIMGLSIHTKRYVKNIPEHSRDSTENILEANLAYDWLFTIASYYEQLKSCNTACSLAYSELCVSRF